MPASIIVRPCTDADWDHALRLIASVFVDEGYVSRQRNERFCRRENIEPHGLLLTAAESENERGAVLGVVVLAHPGGPLNLVAKEGEAEFRVLAVDPRGRGRGVGEMLVRACLERAKAPPWNARMVVIWTQPGMTAAQRLYERVGFVRVPERDATMPPGSEGAGGAITRERWAYRCAMA